MHLFCEFQDEANVVSRLTFWWLTGLIVQGYKQDLREEDLWNLNLEDHSVNVIPVFQKYWNRELVKKER